MRSPIKNPAMNAGAPRQCRFAAITSISSKAPGATNAAT
jgi:hypothetical protein